MRRRVTLLALLTAVAIVLVPTASANGLEIDPTVTSHTEEIYPLYDPDYAQNPGAQADLTQSDDDVQGAAEDADGADDSSSDELIRECTKQALADMAWDLWWSGTTGQGFNFEASAKEAIEDCLKASLGSPESSIAQTIAGVITQGAEAFLNVDPDLDGLADWLQIVDYYYVPS